MGGFFVGCFMESGVYQITNEVNGKRYIGSAVNLEIRKKQHFQRLKKGDHPNIHLRRSCAKHGLGAFSFKVIVNCAAEHVLSWEQTALEGLMPEFNICPTAGSSAGRKFSEETKDKIRQKAIGRKYTIRSAEHRAKLSAVHKGKSKPQHVIDALQAGRRNYIITDEHRLKTANHLRASYVDGRRNRDKTEDHKNKIGQYFSDLTDDQVRQIFELKKQGKSGAEIGRLFKKPNSTICQILKRKRYRWVKIDG